MKAKLVFAVAVAFCVVATDAYGDIFNAAERGTYTPVGVNNNGSGAGPDRAYNTWNSGSGTRSYFAFDRSGWAGMHVVSASFRIQNDTGSPNPTLSLWDFTGNQGLLVGAGGGAAAFADLGTGITYGSGAVPASVLSTIALNAAALDALRNGGGTYFVMGGAIVQTGQLAFFNTGAGDETSLDLVLQANTGPTAVTNGPYVYNPGFNLFLDGSASFDPDEALGDSIVSWEWDVNGDGIYDFSGETYDATWTELMAAGISPDNVYDLALRVTDEMGEQGITMVSLTVTAVPEPATCIIWALTGGTVGLVNMRRRRKARAAA